MNLYMVASNRQKVVNNHMLANEKTSNIVQIFSKKSNNKTNIT